MSPAWRIADLEAALEGEWRLERSIDNGVSLSGRARLSPAEAGRLHYREEGRMRLPHGGSVEAFAEYLFVPDEVGLTIFFCGTPQRLFQTFSLAELNGALTAESLHDCPPDRYASRIAFEADGSWSLRHAVTGPRKGYVSLSTYRRLTPPS